MTVLVTGGAGYIGSHTCVELLNAGYDIVVVDNFVNSSSNSTTPVKEITGKDFSVYNVNLLDEPSLEKVFENHEIKAIIHFAGLKAVAESISNPLMYYQNNIAGTLVLCEVMRKFDVDKLVFSSSATVYGLQEEMPLTEDMPLAPINPYGRTKMMLETILTDIVSANPAWGVSLLRYFNPVGAHPSGKMGENPNGIPNNLFPYITQVANGKLKELTVYGNDYDTPDGTCIRDYIHVVDLADGHLQALNHLLTTTGVHTLNLGTGKGCSVLEVISAFEQATSVSVPYRIGSRRLGDAPISVADVSKAAQLLNWRTKRTLPEMCADAWRWQSKNPNGY